ncbi:MAG: nucleotidyltransferase family protein [Deltaproteobacteria bacterium]|nr:nucleotidyltransferase family protein [Deltaproteobacteria bacterium]
MNVERREKSYTKEDFNSSIDILLRLIKDWVNGVPTASVHASDLQWEVLPELARRIDLTPVVYRQLKASNIHAPEPVMVNLKNGYLNESVNLMKREAALARVIQAMNGQGIVPVFFKGAAFAYTVYPDPVCRTMGDIDLWISESDMVPAQKALERIGYVCKGERAQPLRLEGGYEQDVQMFCTRPGTGLVELHGFVVAGGWMRYTTAFDQTSIRERLVPLVVLGRHALTLSPEDAVIQLALHIAVSHQMSVHMMRSLMDTALLCRHSCIDWELVASRALAWKVATATWLVLRLARDMAGLAGADTTLQRLAPPRWKKRLLSVWVNAHGDWLWKQHWLSIRSAFSDEPRNPSMTERHAHLNHGPLRFVLLLLLIDRAADVCRMIARGIWPDRIWLLGRCGKADIQARLYYLGEAVRGKVVGRIKNKS